MGGKALQNARDVLASEAGAVVCVRFGHDAGRGIFFHDGDGRNLMRLADGRRFRRAQIVPLLCGGKSKRQPCSELECPGAARAKEATRSCNSRVEV